MNFLRRIIGTSLIAGIAAGLFATFIQSIWLTPLILEAETFEGKPVAAALESRPLLRLAHFTENPHSHPHAHPPGGGPGRLIARGDSPHRHAGPNEGAGETAAWAPEDGIERLLFTLLANLLTGIGFALVLAACFALYRGPVDGRWGLLWGLAGFCVFALAPALGLPPEPPGVDAAPLFERQTWWLSAAAATAAGLGLVVFGRGWPMKAAGIAALVLPHLAGAPEAAGHGALPPALAVEFAVASVVSAGLFWLALGGLAGTVYRRIG